MAGEDSAPAAKGGKRGRPKKDAYVHAENIALAFVSIGWKVQPAVRAAVDMILKGDASAIKDGYLTCIEPRDLEFDNSSTLGTRAENSLRYIAKAKLWREHWQRWGAQVLPPQTQYQLSPEDRVIRYLSSEVRKRLRQNSEF